MRWTILWAAAFSGILWNCESSPDDPQDGGAGTGGDEARAGAGGDAGSRGGEGGANAQAGTPAVAGSGVGGAAGCGSDDPECCDSVGSPCTGLAEEECAADAACQVVRGTPFGGQAGAGGASGTGGAAGSPWWEGPFLDFVGCASSCSTGPEAQSCAYDPAFPSTCYYLGSGIAPEGWTVVVDCDPVPPSCAE